MNAPASGGWGPQEWAAMSGMAFGLVGAAGAFAFHAVRVSYRLGRSDEEQANLRERLTKLEVRADSADAQQSAIKVLQGALESLKEQVMEMRQDLKNLMTGRIRSGFGRRESSYAAED